VGGVRVGHFKEPMGLELLTSSRHLTFMERSLATEAFAPERNTGVMIGNHAFNESLNWALGGFTDVGDSGDGPIDSNFRVTGRVSGSPWYEEDGRRLLHLGASGSYIDPEEDVRFRSRPESHLAPRFVDTMVIPSDHTWLTGAEAALVLGPLSLQAEYLRTWVDTMSSGTAVFDGYYVAGSWFITGEHRNYRRSSGTFDRIRPHRNFSLTDGGLGAWEVAVRYSSLDLNDAGINGGCLSDITAGLNWYLNPNMKLQFNYVHAMLDRTVAGVNHDGTAHIVQGRVHVDF
jgi:phosphate-selective porin OprO/OprP